MSKISDYFYEVELKQQTPIVHFQYNQKGVTLRASDFKPRFDAFLYEKDNNTLKKILNRTPQEIEEKKSLPYKLSIEVNPKHTKEIEITDSYKRLYFAKNSKNDEGTNEEDVQIVKMIFCEDIVTLRFFSYDKSLLKILEKYIDEFLCQTNFGLRQSKGFGGFIRSGFNLRDFEGKFPKEKFKLIKFNKRIFDYSYAFKQIADNYNVPKEKVFNNETKKIENKGCDFYIEEKNPEKNPNKDIIERRPSPIMFKYIKPNLYAVFKGKPPKLDNKYWNDELGVRDYLNNGKNKRIWQDI
ncbi:MAG: hypothetical protein N4A32_03415 [Marinifilaceae bacterium]|jgi:hypothetical protein|nr:hypothetical protein [Marinifilaceae bacterium]